MDEDEIRKLYKDLEINDDEMKRDGEYPFFSKKKEIKVNPFRCLIF